MHGNPPGRASIRLHLLAPASPMIEIDGKSYPTLADAARFFKVSAKAVRGYINTGLIPPPPSVDHGARRIDVFPDDYLEDAKRRLAEHRDAKRRARDKKRR